MVATTESIGGITIVTQGDQLAPADHRSFVVSLHQASGLATRLATA